MGGGTAASLRWRRRVEPAISLNRKVTVPVGSADMRVPLIRLRMYWFTVDNDSQAAHPLAHSLRAHHVACGRAVLPPLVPCAMAHSATAGVQHTNAKERVQFLSAVNLRQGLFCRLTYP